MWRRMNAPDFLLRIIKGYRIPFIQKPPLVYPSLYQSNYECPHSTEMTAVIDQMKTQGILEVAEPSPSFISTIFLVPKSDGTARPIFNLKALNRFVLTERFSLLNVHRIPDFLQPRDWLCKIDLSQAYFHLPVTQAHRRFLRLIYRQELLEMTCLPFGLSTAPKVFASITNWIAQTLRRENIRIVVYLDDFLIAHQVKNILVNHVNIVLSRLESLGWIVNYEKSVLKPQRGLVYLGVYWDPWSNQKHLPKDKVSKLISQIRLLLNTSKTNRKDLEKLVGLLNFASFVVHLGRLNYRALLNLLNRMPEVSNQKHAIPQDARADLVWWMHNCLCPSPIHVAPPSHFLTTDASDLAWGALLDYQSLWGLWTCAEKELHCNQKEMLAILNALKDRCQFLSHSTVLVQSDNKTVIAYLRNQGGTRSSSLLQLTYRVFQLLEQYQIQLSLFYLPGEVQQSCRSSIETAYTSRMASSSRMHGTSFFQMGSTSNRPVCFGESSCRNELCIDRPKGSRSPISRRLFKGMEFRTGMDISTPVLDTKGAGSPEPSFRDFSNNSSSMAPCFLACGPQGSCQSRSLYTTSPRQEFTGRDHKSTASECSQDDARSLEVWGWSENLTGWKPEQISLLQSSWRASTRKTYNTAWKKWVAWSTQHKVNTTQPTGADVAKYLTDLYLVDKLSYKTILLYKSVVSTLCNTESVERLSTHVLVKHVLKSIALRNPIDKKTPIWNVEVLSDYLRKSKINHNNIFEVCRRTAVLLLLCSGRRIHDLTLLNIDCNHCVFMENSIIFWPMFGSKTDCANYRQSGWRLLTNESSQNLDPVFWIKQTFSLLKDRRESAKCNSLFISLRGDVKTASRTLIAGWIKSLFREAGITATPGSIRAAVASKNWVDNCSVEDILSRGNWRSENTFKNYYRREVMPAPTMNNAINISNLFAAVD
ncbi:uncharacterized protein [Choristoneura fumiferana]|uniref:uncharacterized protein n=1 Tax=Choristoneura fumiferana TaxID=7141 RepID=UPI003D155FAB